MPGEVGPLGYHAASLIADGVPILISWGGVMVVGQQFTFSLYKLLPYTRPAAALGVPQPTLTRIQNRKKIFFMQRMFLTLMPVTPEKRKREPCLITPPKFPKDPWLH